MFRGLQGHTTVRQPQKIQFSMVVCPKCHIASSDLAWKHNEGVCPTARCGYILFPEATLAFATPATTIIQ